MRVYFINLCFYWTKKYIFQFLITLTKDFNTFKPLALKIAYVIYKLVFNIYYY